MQELWSKIKAKITTSLEETKIDHISPEADGLDKALAVKGYDISSLADAEISQHMYTLSQYIVFLQVQCNVRQIKYIDAKRMYELAIAKAVANQTGKTVKERTNTALLESGELQRLEQDYRLTEADFILFSKVPDSILEVVNAFKKELSLRTTKKQQPYDKY